MSKSKPNCKSRSQIQSHSDTLRGSSVLESALGQNSGCNGLDKNEVILGMALLEIQSKLELTTRIKVLKYALCIAYLLKG